MNSLQQQAKFDAFVHEFNNERPHQALGMRPPADLYTASPKPYLGLWDISYPFHDREILVTACGRICMQKKRINISGFLAGQRLGIKEVDEGIWLVSFMHYDLACTTISDISTSNKGPCGPSTTPSAQGCHPCHRYLPLPMSQGRTQTLDGGRSRTRTWDPLFRSYEPHYASRRRMLVSP
jgi:hypothetical protein